MYRQKSEKGIMGGGGGRIAPCPPLATLMSITMLIQSGSLLFVYDQWRNYGGGGGGGARAPLIGWQKNRKCFKGN